jgi:hypothetical protein
MCYSHSTWLSAEELLMEPLAIPLGSQTTATKRLVMAGHPKDNSQVHPQGVRRGCKGLKAPTIHAGWL